MSNNVKSIETGDSTTLYLEDFKISSKFVINCAGGNSLDIAK